MTLIINQIFKKLEKDRQLIRKIRKESRKQRELMLNLEDKLVHSQEFSHLLQNYTKKLIKKYQIDLNKVEKELKENCPSCLCLFRSIEKFTRNETAKKSLENNFEVAKIKAK